MSIGVDEGRVMASWANDEVGDVGVLLAQHHGQALRLARRISLADPEDLVSEARLKLLESLTRAGSHLNLDTFWAYFSTIIRHVASDTYRREARVVATDELDAGTVPGADDVSDSHSDAAMLTASLADLPARQQRVLWRTVVDGASASEVADDLGLTANAVRQEGFRARAALREAVLRRCVGIAGKTDKHARFLPGLLAGTLSPRRTEALQDHLRECQVCRNLKDDLQRVNSRSLGEHWVVGASSTLGVTGIAVFEAGSAVAAPIAVISGGAMAWPAWLVAGLVGLLALGVVGAGLVLLHGDPATSELTPLGPPPSAPASRAPVGVTTSQASGETPPIVVSPGPVPPTPSSTPPTRIDLSVMLTQPGISVAPGALELRITVYDPLPDAALSVVTDLPASAVTPDPRVSCHPTSSGLSCPLTSPFVGDITINYSFTSTFTTTISINSPTNHDPNLANNQVTFKHVVD